MRVMRRTIFKENQQFRILFPDVNIVFRYFLFQKSELKVYEKVSNYTTLIIL